MKQLVEARAIKPLDSMKLPSEYKQARNAVVHQLIMTDPDRAFYYKLVLAGGPSETSKDLLDEAGQWVASRGARQAGSLRVAHGIGLDSPVSDGTSTDCRSLSGLC